MSSTDAPNPKVTNAAKSKKSYKSKDKSKSSGQSREAPKKTFRIVIRKLPVRNFTLDNFKECLVNTVERLGCQQDNFEIDHFLSGKIR